jgi:hypothetical protein
MTVREAAQALDLSLWRAWQLCSTGVIPSWQVNGRLTIPVEEVEAYALAFQH